MAVIERIGLNASGDQVIKMQDNVELWFGDGASADDFNLGDVKIYWDGTNLILDATADDTLIEIGDSASTQKSFDIKWYGNDASGAAYLYYDASANLIYTTGVDIQFKDNDLAVFGTGAGAAGDVGITWDGTNLIINAVADDSLIEIGDSGATQKSFDLKWYGNASSGAEYLYFDASASLIYSTGVDLQLKDNDMLVFGDGAGGTGDAQLRWDATDLDLLPTADDSVFKIGNGTLSFDVWIYGNTATDYILWDASANALTVAGAASLAQKPPVTLSKATGSVTAADSGGVFVCLVDAVITLPSTVAGLTYTFITGALSSGTGLSISPAAADNIVSTGLTAVDNKDLINTGATDVVGDCVTLVGDGVDGWNVTNMRGIWAKEA